MEIKMRENYQGHRNKGIFAPNEVHEVEYKLGEYLVMHGKAVEIVTPADPKPVAKKKPAAKKKAVKK